jgi:hypothetical protein
MAAITAVIVLFVVGICVAYQYLKGTLLRSVITTFTVISTSIVAFGYFEPLASLLISRGKSSSAMLPYWQPLAFAVLFIVSFAVLQAVASAIAKKSVTVAPLADKLGRTLCGAISGLILAGLLITVLGMAPIKDNIPYQRFQVKNPNPDKPTKAIMNVDGLAAALFKMVSRGSLSGQNSFAVIHPSFIDEIHLNRLPGGKDVSLLTPSSTIEIPSKAAAWPAPANLKAADGTAVNPRTGHDLIVVRVGIKRSAGAFSLSQLRLVCNRKENEPLKGSALNAYPAGYFTAKDRVKTRKLSDKIDIPKEDFKGGVKWIDFVFNIPGTHVPVLVVFKQNSIAPIPKLVSTEDAPPVETF